MLGTKKVEDTSEKSDSSSPPSQQLSHTSISNETNGEKELITEHPNTNTSEILEGGSEFKLEDDVTQSSSIEVEGSGEQSGEQSGGGVSVLVEYKIKYLVPALGVNKSALTATLRGSMIAFIFCNVLDG